MFIPCFYLRFDLLYLFSHLTLICIVHNMIKCRWAVFCFDHGKAPIGPTSPTNAGTNVCQSDIYGQIPTSSWKGPGACTQLNSFQAPQNGKLVNGF